MARAYAEERPQDPRLPEGERWRGAPPEATAEQAVPVAPSPDTLDLVYDGYDDPVE